MMDIHTDETTTPTRKKREKRGTGTRVIDTEMGRSVVRQLLERGKTLNQWIMENHLVQGTVCDILKGRLTGQRRGKTGNCHAIMDLLTRDFGIKFPLRKE